jgi:hypothetical protein
LWWRRLVFILIAGRDGAGGRRGIFSFSDLWTVPVGFVEAVGIKTRVNMIDGNMPEGLNFCFTAQIC